MSNPVSSLFIYLLHLLFRVHIFMAACKIIENIHNSVSITENHINKTQQ